MDELDKKILGALLRNCRVSYQELSRHHGISANAIRRRILNLEESGVIHGYSLLLSPAMLGVSRILGILSADGSRDEVEVMDEIGAHGGVIASAAYSNGTYALIGEYRTAEELLDLSSYLRCIESIKQADIHQTLEPKGVHMELSRMHLRVLKTLINEPRLSVVEISKESGLSARRVRRLLSQLEEGGSVQFRALVELGAATSIPFLAEMTWNERQANFQEIVDWIQKEYPLSHWETYVSASEPLIYSLLAVENLTELNTVARNLRRHKHILTVKTLIAEYHKFYPSITRRTLLQMIAEAYPDE